MRHAQVAMLEAPPGAGQSGPPSAALTVERRKPSSVSGAGV
jgi:hypothetical protein